ncbi:MAG: hypothetical protein HYV27_01760 [Candidatus Hydrogenedentes bacterium]|nr:hypothetical protein [Candidatus Hydrogenedentota bacterium]
MKEMIKSLINGCLSPLQLEVRHIERPKVDSRKHLALIEETIGCYRELGFAPLPPSPRRAELMARLTGTNVSEAIYVLEHLRRALKVPGDICEFGVAAGATSALMANEIQDTDRKLWLFDSFQGLPRPTEKDVLIDDILGVGSMEAYEGRMAFPIEEVRGRLRELNFPPARTMIVPGFIEKTIHSTALPAQVAFAYIDFDFYEPILIALNFLHETMPVGGHLIVDDYGCFSAGAQTAVDEFLAAHAGAYSAIKPYPFAGQFLCIEKTA